MAALAVDSVVGELSEGWKAGAVGAGKSRRS